MKLTARFAALLALSLAGSGASFASTINLASYGSAPGTATPSGANNSALKFTATTSPNVNVTNGRTYDIGTGGIWSNPVGNSSWVSYNPNTYPGGSVRPGNGTFTYTSTFSDSTASTSSGSITVMADDTVSVYLNNTLIASAAAPNPATHCTMDTPNCTTPATYNLSGFIDGTNTLTFIVNQDFDNATGLDFSGSVTTTATPEPGSLMLLGTGLLGVGGQLYRRRRIA